MGEQGELFGPTSAEPKRPKAQAAGAKGAASKPASGHRPHPQRDRWPRLEVALSKPLRQTFTYLCEPGAHEGAAPGVRVRVPFGQRKEVGVVVGLSSDVDLPSGRLRAIESVLDDQPVVSAELLELTRWISEEYACGWGEALAAVLPAPLKHARGSRKVTLIRATDGATPEVLEELEERFAKQHRLLRQLVEIGGEVEARDLLRKLDLSNAPLDTLVKKGLVEKRAVEQELAALLTGDRERERPEQLSPDQAKAVAAITASVDTRAGDAYLLHGVTGSGKTEVYLRAIEHALAAGRGAIALVPEISLTPQTVSWFTSRFGEVAVMHSRLTDAQRLTMWRRVQRGELKVVVGARSATRATCAARPPGVGRRRPARCWSRAARRPPWSPWPTWPRALGPSSSCARAWGPAPCPRSKSSTCARSRRPSTAACSRAACARPSKRPWRRASRASCSSTAAASRRCCGAAPATTWCAAALAMRR
jgi:hypothetical protein